MKVSIDGPLAPYSFSWTLINSTMYMTTATSTLFIKLSYDGQYFDYDMEKVTVTFEDSTQIYASSTTYEMVDTGFDLYLHGKEQEVNGWHMVGLWIFVVFYVVIIGVSLGLIFLGFTGWIAFDMICTLQILHLTPVCKLYLPSVLLEFFKMFRYSNFEGLAFGEWQFNRAIDEDGFTLNHLSSGYNFEKMGYDSRAFFSLTAD
jgi:hypothetical protein